MRPQSMLSLRLLDGSGSPPCLSLITPLLLAAALSSCASGGDPTVRSLRADVPLSSQLHRDFYLRDGLPSSWINDVVQTRDDYVWIATDNGLVRYDGVNFKLFNSAFTPQLPINEIRVLHESRDGVLWIGTTVGLTRYSRGRPGAFQEVPTLLGKQVLAIYEDHADGLWIGTQDGTYKGGVGLEFYLAEEAPESVRAICEDRSGTLWMGSNAGLFRRRGKTYEQVTHERLPTQTSAGSGVLQTRVNTIFDGDDGGLWIGTNRALLHMVDGEFTSRGQELDSQQVYDVTQTRDGSLYVGARFGLYRSVADGSFQKISSNPSAFCLVEDHDGGLWVGHGDNRGLHRYRNNPAQEVWTKSRVRCLFHAPDWNSHDSETVAEESDGGIWFGASDGLHHWKNGVVTDYGIKDGLTDPRIQSITSGDGNSLWIGTARGFVKWTGTGIESANTPAGMAEMNIGTALQDSRGVLWFSLSSRGGYRLKDGVLSEIVELSDRRIQWFWESPDGVIWIGHESGLFQYDQGKLRQIHDRAFERLKQPRFLCHFVTSDGTLWIGTSNGIARYREGKFCVFPPDSGLQVDNIERLIADDSGNLWFGGRDGLFRTDMAQLEAYATGDLAKLSATRIGGFDRFPPLIAFSQGCLVRNGELLIAAEAGLVKMPIDSFGNEPAAPVVYIEQATIDDQPQSFEQSFEYLSGRRRLSIQFSVPALVEPQHIQVRYRLEGHDDKWVDAENARVAQYTDLRPGAYRFRVAARRANREWFEATTPVSFAVRPRWWEQQWLQVTAVLLTGLTGLGLAHYRIQSFRHANAALRREIADRKRAENESRTHQEQLSRVSRAASMGELTTSIAHEVKQPLFAIVSNAQTARRLLDVDTPDVDEVRDALSDIADDGNRASRIIDRVRSLVKKEHLLIENLNLNEVARDAVTFAEPEFCRLGFNITTKFASRLPAIKGDPIELQQVILNLLLNAAQAMEDVEPKSRQLSLRTSATVDHVELAVEDHGTGFDAATLDKLFEPFFTTKPEGTGMGLAINRTIVEAHGGRIWATQNEEEGMTFRFSLPVGESSSADALNERQEVSS